MSLLFTSSPPKFSKKEVYNFLKKRYRLNGNLYHLDSDRDQNFLLKTSSKKYLIKIYNNFEELKAIQIQRSMIEFIRRENFQYQIPKIFGKIKNIQRNDINYFTSIFHFIEGKQLNNEKLNLNNYRDMGIFLGNFSRILSRFKHKRLSRIFKWDVRNIKFLKNKIQFIDGEGNRYFVNDIIRRYNKITDKFKKRLRYSFIHNDVNDQNILIHPDGKIKGIIDFGDVTYSYTLLEAAICMSYIGQDKKNPIKIWESFLEGYLSKYSLTQEEIMVLPTMISARLCLSVIMCSWRKKIFPENNYLTISEKKSWGLLNFLKKRHKTNLFNNFI